MLPTEIPVFAGYTRSHPARWPSIDRHIPLPPLRTRKPEISAYRIGKEQHSYNSSVQARADKTTSNRP